MSLLNRLPIVDGMVFCGLQGRDIPLSACLDCPGIKAINERGRSPFVICDTGRRTDDEDAGQLVLNWWLKRGRQPAQTTRE